MVDCGLLRVVSGPSTGRQTTLSHRLVIGRSDAGLRIDDPTTSRAHAVVQISDATAEGCGAADAVTVADAGSSRGTTLDGVAVTTPVPFPQGATLRVGKSEVRRLRVVRHADPDGVQVVLRGPGAAPRTYTVSSRVDAGREEGRVIRIDDPAISRRHLVLERRDSVLTVRDTGSRGGVLLNGRPVEQAVVREGDEIEFAGTEWVLQVVATRTGGTPREFRVRVEGTTETHALQIDAEPTSTVGSAADAVADAMGIAPEHRATFYRDSDGVVLHPDDLWSASRLVRGELLVLADMDLPVEAPVQSTMDPRDEGTRVVRPGTRRLGMPTTASFTIPRAPEPATMQGRGIGWQLGGAAVGLVGGLVIAVAMNNWLFAIIGGLAGIGAAVFTILGDQSRRRHRVREFERAVDEIARGVEAATRAQALALEGACPAPDARAGLVETGDVWERLQEDDDHLRLRLGIGVRPALVRITRAPDDPAPELARILARVDDTPHLRDVPVQTPAGGVIGVVGSNREVDALLRSLLLDAAVHHAPSTLGIHLLAEADEMDFALWLPHVADAVRSRLTSGAGTADLPSASDMTSRVADRVNADIADGRRVLIIIRGGGTPGWGDLLHTWRPEHGLVIVTAPEVSVLPREASAWIVLDGAVARVEGDWADGPCGQFRPDQVSHAAASALALDIARLVDAHAPQVAAFSSRSLLELSGARTGQGIDIGRNWHSGHRRLDAVLGITDAGEPAEVELRHTVIAGTTGSGKSELLATMLASLIARQSPEELTLFLIDFKGGATFNRFASAAHVVGVVTDLESDERLARRAFRALDVELRRRKHLLGAARVNDIGHYRDLGTEQPLPTLLVVIDEFALLAQTVPDVKAQLDTIAAQGRSLGIFLVLATQSPTGVVTAAIRSNTDLWLSLRVVSDQESREILGAPDAARLPVDAPGRALLRRGAETTLTGFQTARVTVVTAAAGSALVTVRPFGRSALPVRTSATSQRSDQDDDLQVLLDRIDEQVRRERIAPPPALWMPPLPTDVTADELSDAPGDGALTVRLGLSDLVMQQEQPTFGIDLAATGLLVTGAPRSGRSTTLLQVAADLSERHPPRAVHLYGLHADGALDPLAALPHTAGIVQVDDVERVARLLERLTRLVEARRSAPRRDGEARIVLLVDDYPAVRDALEQRAQGRPLDQLMRLTINGRPSGVHVVIATPQPTDMRMAVLAGLGHRLMLRAIDRSDYQALSMRIDTGDQPPPLPGRALSTDGTEVQVAHADLTRARALASGWPPDGGPAPLRALPELVALGEIPPVNAASVDVIGIGGLELEPAVVDASPGAHLAILGESGTGRSTALRALAEAHLRRPGSRVLVFAPRGGPLQSLADRPGVVVVGADGADALLAAASAEPAGLLVVIDDADRWPSSASDGLERLVRLGRDCGVRVAVGLRAGDWSRSFEGWTRFIASLKSGLLLSGFAELGPSFDVRLEPLPAPVPGRGYLIARGRAELVQVAQP